MSKMSEKEWKGAQEALVSIEIRVDEHLSTIDTDSLRGKAAFDKVLEVRSRLRDLVDLMA